MRKINTLIGAGVFSMASVVAQADIKSVDDADLINIDGQLGLIDSTRYFALAVYTNRGLNDSLPPAMQDRFDTRRERLRNLLGITPPPNPSIPE